MLETFLQYFAQCIDWNKLTFFAANTTALRLGLVGLPILPQYLSFFGGEKKYLSSLRVFFVPKYFGDREHAPNPRLSWCNCIENIINKIQGKLTNYYTLYEAFFVGK